MKFTQSLRWQMQFWHGLLLAVALSGFGSMAYRHQKSNDLKRIDLALERGITLMLSGVREESRQREQGQARPVPRHHRPRLLREFLDSDEAKRLLASNELEDDYVIVWRRNGVELDNLGNLPDKVPFPGAKASEPFRAQRTRGDFREVYEFLRSGECLLLGKSIRPERQRWHRLRWQLAGSGLGILALGLVGGWLFLSRSIRPIQAISQSARRFAGGQLDARIPSKDTGGELGQLTADLNDTFDQLEKSFVRQTRFTADAAHELRTPVSVILSHAQAALAREREAGAYKDALTTCERGANRLRQLIDSLLTLSSLDANFDEVAMQSVDLASIAKESATFLTPLLESQQLTLETQFKAAPCLGRTDQLHQVFTNLLANAVHFSEPGSSISVSTGEEEMHVWARVSDQGKGIAAEHLPHLFERFYRADASRRRGSGGAGLGLAICQEIVREHGGTIEVESEEGVGTTFTVTLPVER